MGRIVVTGGAGSLGLAVARLVSAREEPSALVVIDTETSDRLPPGTEQVVLDLQDDPERLRRAMEGASTLIHLAWRTPDGINSTEADEVAARATNLASLRNVLDAAAHVGLDQVIHLSSATVYGAWPDNPVPLSEGAALRPNPEFEFAVTKAEAERTVAAWAEAHPEVSVTVLRPAVTLGEQVRPLYRALSGTRSPRTDEGVRPMQFLHVDDLASAVVFAVAKRLDGVYNVAADRGVPEDTVGALAGGVARLALPTRLAHEVAAWSWSLWRLGSPREASAYARWPWVIAPDRLMGEGWTPRYSSEEALVATDSRSHWDDLPPGRRQNLTVLAAAGGALALSASVVAVVMSHTRRVRRRS